MTTTPLATIAEALIEFILSILRDPSAAQQFAEDPEESLTRAGLGGICGDDVRAVLPVIVDHPDVVVRPPAPQPIIVHVPGVHAPSRPDVVREISTVANNFHIDNRSTIVDQSVNQNIWAEGDVSQLFDQEAALAVGDNSVAAGDNALIDESDTVSTIGDVAIGNTDTDVSIDDSFNDESTEVDINTEAEVDESFNDESTEVEIDSEIEDSFNETETTEVSVDTDIVDSSPEAASFEAAPVVELSAEPIDEPDEYVPAFVDVDLPDELDIEETS